MDKPLKKSEVNHLRRLLAWVDCEIGQSPDEYVATAKNVVEKIGDVSDEAKQRIMEGHAKSANVPKYVRDAVKALRKTVKRYDGDIVDGDFEEIEEMALGQDKGMALPKPAGDGD